MMLMSKESVGELVGCSCQLTEFQAERDIARLAADGLVHDQNTYEAHRQ